jgi:hypothetical protein
MLFFSILISLFVYNQKVEEKSKEVYAHRGELGMKTSQERRRREKK